MTDHVDIPESQSEENPPIFKKWSWWYIFILGYLGSLILFFYLVTITFR